MSDEITEERVKEMIEESLAEKGLDKIVEMFRKSHHIPRGTHRGETIGKEEVLIEEFTLDDFADGVSRKALTTIAQTILGIKTFSSIPVLPASDPTSDNQAVRKAYADSLVGSKIIWKSSPVTLSMTSDDNWHAYDFTSIASANAKGVILSVYLYKSGESPVNWMYTAEYNKTSWEGYIHGNNTHTAGMIIQGIDSEQRMNYAIYTGCTSKTIKLIGYWE